MDRIGPIVRLSTEGTIIARARSAPPIGGTVCDNRGRGIGRIVRVTGPVSAPYVIIRPQGEVPEGLMRLVGRDVYLSREREARDRPRIDGRERYQRTDRGGSDHRGGFRRDDRDRRGHGRGDRRGSGRPRV